LEKGPRYDFHDEGKEEQKEPVTSPSVMITPSSSEQPTQKENDKATDEMITESTATKASQGMTTRRLKKSRRIALVAMKLQHERKIRHLASILAPILAVFIFLLGLTSGIAILVWQLDWVNMLRIRWHVSKAEFTKNFLSFIRDG
jgi:hypothetical protein